MLQIYNTLSKTKEVFTPLVGNDSRPGKPVFNRTVTLRDSWGQG